MDRDPVRVRFVGYSVIVLALVSRGLWLLAPATEIGDALEYRRLASWLVARHLFSDDGRVPSSYRPPLYPALIALADVVSGHPMATMLVLQVVVATATVLLTYLIADELFGEPVAILCGALLALAPMTSRFSTVILTETVFTFLIVLGMWAWLRSRTLLGGIALGLATLTRASSLPYLILLAAYGLLRRREPSGRSALVVALAALVTVSPWVGRNLVEVDRFTVADAGWGLNLFYGTIDLQSGSNRWSQLLAAHARIGTGTLSPNSTSQTANGTYPERQARQFALSWIRQHPLTWIRIRLRQWRWLFIDTGDYLPVAANKLSFRDAIQQRRLSTVALKAAFVGGNVLLILFAIRGVSSLAGRLTETMPVWTFPVYLSAAHAAVYVEPRYGLPLVPFLTMLAAVGVNDYVHRFRASSAGVTVATVNASGTTTA